MDLTKIIHLFSINTLIKIINIAYVALRKKNIKPIGEIDNPYIYSILLKYMINGEVPKMTDMVYRFYKIEDVDFIVQQFQKQGWTYTAEFRDCDNFAMKLYSDVEEYLPGCTFGVEMVNPGRNYHCINSFIDKDGVKWYYEPQTGNRVKADDPNCPYKPDWSLM